jgi:hypothetical protein
MNHQVTKALRRRGRRNGKHPTSNIEQPTSNARGDVKRGRGWKMEDGR